MFDLSPAALQRAVLRVIVRIVVGLPPVKKALLSRQVSSRFLWVLAGQDNRGSNERGIDR